MMRKNTAWFSIFLGILLILSYIILGRALVLKCSWLNGSHSMQKVLVSVKNQKENGAGYFSMTDIKRLKKELQSNDISYAAQSGLINTFIVKGRSTYSAKLTGTDYMYPAFNSLTLVSGSFITQKQEEEGAMVAVIDHELAETIFKSKDVIGQTLDIFGCAFIITGVVKGDDSIIGKFTDDGLPDVYIPARVMLEVDSTSRITAFQTKTAGTDTLNRYTAVISEALRKIGKDPANYSMIDYNLKRALMQQGPLMVVFFLGLASILQLLVMAKKIIKRLFLLIRDGCRADYLMLVIKHNSTVFGSCIVQLLFILLGAVLIIWAIRFKLYIPPMYIPDELIDFSYYIDLIKGLIQGGMQSMGYIAPRTELIANMVNAIMNILFFIFVLVGLLLLYHGFQELGALEINKVTLICGLFLIAAVVFLETAACLAGLPFILEAKSVLVFWTFIFIKVLSMKNKIEERGIENV